MKRFFLWLLLVLDRLSLWIETMTNMYYTPSGVPATQNRGSSLAIRAEFAAIQAGFDAVGNLLSYGASGSTFNVAVGNAALSATTSGIQNTAVGSEAMDSLTTGSGNTAVGRSALGALVGGVSNVAVGDGALPNASSSNNCVAVGGGAGFQQSSGSSHVFVGGQAGYSNFNGSENTFVGYRACYGSVGSRNTAVGQGAGYGTGSGALTTGDNNTLIGYRALPSAAVVNNEFTLGNSSVATLRCQVTSITSLSDERDKTAISDLSFGLDFIASLRPVAFTWDTRDGAKVGVRSSGFLAQDLKAAQDKAGAAEVLRLVYEENPDKLEASYGHLIPVLVKAIQELKAEVDSLRLQPNGQ